MTIKIRKGFDDTCINAPEVAKIAEAGAAAIAHGRTREQYYSGNADWEIIRVKEGSEDSCNRKWGCDKWTEGAGYV